MRFAFSLRKLLITSSLLVSSTSLAMPYLCITDEQIGYALFPSTGQWQPTKFPRERFIFRPSSEGGYQLDKFGGDMLHFCWDDEFDKWGNIFCHQSTTKIFSFSKRTGRFIYVDVGTHTASDSHRPDPNEQLLNPRMYIGFCEEM